MTRKTIICCALTGGSETTGKSKAVPVTPAEIAQSGIDAAKAGAAIVHIHVRDPATGKPSMKLEHYREVVERIRSSGTDVIINLTTGPGARYIPGADDPLKPAPGSTLVKPSARVSHILALRPEICSLDMGSLNMGDWVFINTPAHLAEMAAAIGGAGVTPELEVFEAGHVMLARAMQDDGRLESPGLFQICLGVRWGAPATAETLSYMRALLPAGATWFAFGVGITQFPIAAAVVRLGGNVRVGLEDNLYLERGVLAPSNAALVEKAAAVVRSQGSEPATVAEARIALGLALRK